MSASADDFITILSENLSPLVHAERTVNATFRSARGFASRPRESSVYVAFYNLPTERVKQRRGGGAEAENNRMTFSVRGFEEDPSVPVDKVKIEQWVSSIGGRGRSAPKMRSKTAGPEKIAAYVADYINQIAEQFEPNFTHE